jgi:flagellar biosynthesis/type III secretory pathway chaperone
MQTSDSALDWETNLASLLSELSNVQNELLEILVSKRECMADGDVEGMTKLQPREQELCERLQACHNRRTEMLSHAAEHGLPAENLGKLAASLKQPKKAELQKQVKDIKGRMRILQHTSLANWVLAQRTVLHLSQLLEIVATGGRLQPTYERGKSAMSSGALVDGEA